jgi:hypothetical protein
MSDIHLVINPGGEMKSLYRDELMPVFNALGNLEVPGRASDIVFKDSQWHVLEFDGDKRIYHPKGFDTRAAAISHEINILQEKYL